ncbi:MAG: hypothetical protein Q4F57_05460 [Weeksellaceae bacterium]|nr:hypothetical protein [Weeksellaceae bacterium]
MKNFLFLIIFCCFSSVLFAQEVSRKDTLTFQTQDGLPVAASKIYFTDAKFTVSGFGESNFINYLGEKNTESGDLELYFTNLQRLVFYAAYKPTNWLVLYAEIFAEYINDGSHEDHFEFLPELFADFLISEKFNMRVGTHQVKIGFLNNRDEPIMYYSVNRPEVERLIIPSTWIDLGIMTYGKVTDDLSWSASLYQALDPNVMFGNSWIRQGRSETLRMNFNGYTLNGGLEYRGIENTEIVANGVFARMAQDNMVSNTTLLSSFIRHTRKNWTAMALGALGFNDNTEGIYDLTFNPNTAMGEILGKRNFGYYVEMGYDLLSFFPRATQNAEFSNFLYNRAEFKLPLFLRYERLNTHQQVAQQFENSQFPSTDLSAWTLGLNFNPRHNIVLKSNYQFRNNKVALPNGLHEGDRFEFGLGFIF